MNKIILFLIFLVLSIVFVSGCDNDDLNILNDPVADAGTNSSCFLTASCPLNGSGSDGTEALSYAWYITVDGCSGSLLNANTSSASITPTAAGECTVSLEVKDANGFVSTDTVLVVGSHVIANAGVNQTVSTGTLVTLNGSASQGAITTYTWALVDNACGGTLSGTTGPAVTITPINPAVCRISLVVDDGTNYSDPDYVNVIGQP